MHNALTYDETEDQLEGLRRPLSNKGKPTNSAPSVKVDPETGEVIDPPSG